MTDNIDVKPSADETAVAVATDVVDSVHYPLYKLVQGVDGEAILISAENPLPTQGGKVETLLNELIVELRILNAYNALGHDEVITEDDLEIR